MVYNPTTWNTDEVITKDKLNKIEQGLHAVSKLSGIDIDGDKDWNEKSIRNLWELETHAAYICVRNGIVDIPGTTVRRVWESNISVSPNSTVDVQRITIPFSYSSQIASNATFAITCRMSGWGGQDAGFSCKIIRINADNSETEIGSASPWPGSDTLSMNITTTAGFFLGDWLDVRISVGGYAPQVSSTRIEYKSARAKNIPIYAAFPETEWESPF